MIFRNGRIICSIVNLFDVTSLVVGVPQANGHINVYGVEVILSAMLFKCLQNGHHLLPNIAMHSMPEKAASTPNKYPSVVSNDHPLKHGLTSPKRWKSEGAKSGESGMGEAIAIPFCSGNGCRTVAV
jgi:hypothetical protein